MLEYRCGKCDKLLMRFGESTTGHIEIKCYRCKHVTTHDIRQGVATSHVTKNK